MTVIEIARIYTDLVNLDDQIPPSEHVAKEEVGELRTRYHQILMDKFQEMGIEYLDRFDATRKAFDIVKNPDHLKVVQSSLIHVRKTA